MTTTFKDFLNEDLSPLQNTDISFIKRTLQRPLSKKDASAEYFQDAASQVERKIVWASSWTKNTRADLSNPDSELHSLIMRFTLAWYKKEVEELGQYGPATKREFQNQSRYLRNWLKSLKYSKFPQHEMEILYKMIITPKNA